MNISNFYNNLQNLVSEDEFLNTSIIFGNAYYNKVLNININRNIYNRFRDFITSKYETNIKTEKIYYFNDIKLYSYNDNTHICVRELPSKSFDFKINDYNYIRLICKNQRAIDNINFPSIIKYDNIDENKILYSTIKYKNSEIIIEFIECEDIFSINFKSKIDKFNITNFINNFQFIIGKLLLKRLNLANSENNSQKITSKQSFSRQSI